MLLLPLGAQTANYEAAKAMVDGVEVVRLADSSHRMEVSIVTSIGNIAYDLKVNGKSILYVPFHSLGEFKEHPTLAGNPLLAPWANRIDQLAYYANGKKYLLNPELKNLVFLYGGTISNHGLVAYSPNWEITSLEADDHSARMTSRLEFWKYPELMAQFPLPIPWR